MTNSATGYHEVPVQSRIVFSTARQITDRSTVTGPVVLPEKPLVVPAPGGGGKEEGKRNQLTAVGGLMAFIGSEYKFLVTVTLSLLTLVGALYVYPKVRPSSGNV